MSVTRRWLRPGVWAIAVSLSGCDLGDILDNTTEGTPVVQAHEVTSLVLAVDGKGEHVALAYGLGCQNCDVPAGYKRATPGMKDVVKTQVRMFLPGNSEDGSSAPVLIENALDDGRLDALTDGIRAGVGDASRSWLLWERSNGTVALLAVPFDAKDGTSTKTVELPGFKAVGRDDRATALGTMRRGGQMIVSSKGSVHAIVQGAEGDKAGQLVVPEIADFAVAATPVSVESGEFLAITSAGDLAAGAWTVAPKDPSSLDRGVHFKIEHGETFQSTAFGAPAAVWSDGKQFRVAIRDSAGGLTLWNGRSTEELLAEPDASACSAVAFDAKGNPIVLQVGAAGVITTIGGKPQTLKSFANGEGLATHSASRTSCALAVAGERLHVAWTETDPAAAEGDKGRATVIESWTLDGATASAVLKTRHDTAKNSVSNIR
jgi:hypothetical protein